MNIRCIALDLDRTTLNARGVLSDGNRKALEYAISRGVQIVIASGRPLGSLPADVLAVPGIEYAITSNGAAVYHLPTGERLAHYTLQPELVELMLRFTADLPYPMETFIDGKAFADADFLADPMAYGAPEKALPYLQRTRTPVADMPAFLREHIEELESLDFITCGPEDHKRICAYLRPLLPHLYITSSVPHLLEISHKDGGKHSGVGVVAQRLGIALDDMVAFGDGDNDADLLRCVGCGVAVANASPACMAAADRVTLDYDDDGVGLAIMELLAE